MNEPATHAPLEIEDTPVEVTEKDMASLDNPHSKAWKRIAPEDKARRVAELRADAKRLETLE